MVSFSVIIISNGREDQLLKCLDSLRPQTKAWQLILLNSDELLPQSVIDKAQSLTGEVELLQGKSRQEAIAHARYEWLFFLEPAASLYPHYWEVAEKLLLQEKIGILGGSDTLTLGMNKFNQALAIALASPLCTGKTYTRHQSLGHKLIPATEEILSTAHLWMRKGSEQNSMFYHPQLVVGYDRRETLKSLMTTTFHRGQKRSQIIQEKMAPKGLYWLPAIFVLLHLLVLTGSPLFWDLARVYLGLIVMMGLNMGARKQKMGLFLQISFLHYFIVFMYGLGFLAYRVGIRGPGSAPNIR